MRETNVTSVYDLLGEDYFSKKHRSVEFNNDVQRFPIIYACIHQAKRLNRPLEELDVLNIGVGGGQQRSDLCICSLGLGCGRVSDHRLVDLDVSQTMLEVASELFPSKGFLEKLEKTKENVKQVKGDATDLTRYFNNDSFDIVVAALCDPIEPQEKMYHGALKVLKKDGIFITTYPHKDLATVIRRNIYHINLRYTRYKIDDKEYIARSYAPLPEDVSDLFMRTGFTDIQTRTLKADSIFYNEIDPKGMHKVDDNYWWYGEAGTCPGHRYVIPDTMMKAREKLGLPIGELPVLVFGEGRKPNND
jgi:SAM-dependent methyltransferase